MSLGCTPPKEAAPDAAPPAARQDQELGETGQAPNRQKETAEPAPTNTDTVNDTAAAAPQELDAASVPDPKPPSAWPAAFATEGLPDAFGLILIRPETLLNDLEKGKQVLAQLDPSTAEHLSLALEQGLQDLVKLLQPAEWTASGLATQEHIIVQLALRCAEDERNVIRAILDAPELTDALMKLAAAEDTLRSIPLVLRLLIPLDDRDKARAFLSGALSALASTPAQAIEGYEAVFDINGSFAIGINERNNYLSLDLFFLPWFNADELNQHLAASRQVAQLVAGERQDLTPSRLVAPENPDVDLYASADLRGLRQLNTLLLLTAAASNPHRIDELRSAAQSAELLLADSSPFCSLSLESSKQRGIVAAAHFCQSRAELVAQFQPQPSLDVPSSIFAAGFSPLIAAFDGPWVEEGLSPPRELKLNMLLQALTVEAGLLPLMAPAWGIYLPHLLWRDLVPATARYAQLDSLERVQAFVGAGGSATPPLAIAIIDKDASIDLHRHGLACLSQRRPVQGKCADDRIQIGQLSSTKTGQQTLHYLLKERDDAVLSVFGLEDALVSSLSTASITSTATLAELQIDFEALVASPIAADLGESLLITAKMLKSAQAKLLLLPNSIEWQLELSPPLSLAELGVSAGPAILEYMRKGKEVEALIMLESLGVASVAYRDAAADAHFPLAPEARCSAGALPHAVYASPGDTDWSQAPWSVLGFRLPHPHVFRYCYQSSADGLAFSAWAEAALAGEAVDSRFCVQSNNEQSGLALTSVSRLDAAQPCLPPSL
ncbi:MAG: hypothetical protein RBU37_19670 [Myxococcota bacterium]|nr:hypothetical protein [Myxococcota bacterium]